LEESFEWLWLRRLLTRPSSQDVQTALYGYMMRMYCGIEWWIHHCGYKKTL
jgi:hypothetical protein